MTFSISLRPVSHAIRVRGRSHWDGCYDTHWDCAIRKLRKALDDMVSAIEEGWSGRYLGQKLDRAIDVLNATEEKYDDRP